MPYLILIGLLALTLTSALPAQAEGEVAHSASSQYGDFITATHTAEGYAEDFSAPIAAATARTYDAFGEDEAVPEPALEAPAPAPESTTAK